MSDNIYTPYPLDEWIEGLTADQALYHLKRMKRVCRKEGFKVGKISCLLDIGQEWSDWMNVTQSFAEEVIRVHKHQSARQRLNCIMKPRFRIKLHTYSSYGNISLWPYALSDYTQHSSHCECKGGTMECHGFGDEEE